MKTVNAQSMSEALYTLFQAKPWLIETGELEPLDPLAEAEAVSFLLTLAAGGPDGWGKTPQNVKNVVCGLLIDFMAKLVLPNSPFMNTTWQVIAGAELWRQALEVIAFEISRVHPSAGDKH